MATYNIADGGSSVIPAGDSSPIQTIKKVIKMEDVNNGNGAAQNDVLQAINIPANTIVRSVHAHVKVGETSLVFDLGDGADPNGWIDGVDGATTGEQDNSMGEAYAAGKNYAAADTIDLVVTSAPTAAAAVIEVAAVVERINF